MLALIHVEPSGLIWLQSSIDLILAGVIARASLYYHRYCSKNQAHSLGLTVSLVLSLCLVHLLRVWSLWHSELGWVETTSLIEVGIGVSWVSLLIRSGLTAVDVDTQLASSPTSTSDSLFQQLIETIDSVFWIRDPIQNQLLYLSPSHQSFWDHSELQTHNQAETLGDHSTASEHQQDGPQMDTGSWFPIHGEDQQHVLTQIASQLDTGYDLEYRIRDKDGAIRWIRDRAFPIKDDQGKAYRVVGIATDITERKVIEIQLREREERFRQIAENIRDVFWILDPGSSGIKFYVSPAYESIWGRPRSSVSDDPFSFIDAAHPDDLEYVRLAYDELILQGKELDLEFRIVQPNGSIRWIHDRGFIVKSEIVSNRFVGIATDITERKEANALRDEILQRQAVERELREFTLQLERSNQELQDFAYVASHDLQEPLRKIQAFGNRLRQKCGDVLGDKGLDYLERMENAAERAQALINDLLAFSRITTKAQPFAEANLAQIVANVLSDLEVAIEKAEAQVSCAGLPTLQGDPRQMQQLFQNLLSNALKFRRADVKPRIEVQGLILHHPDRYQITIADNGIGFEAKYTDRIFQVFQRLHSRSDYEGTGVGLAICRKIVERHGGLITAESELGHGSTFVITLPVDPTISLDPDSLKVETER